MKVKILRSTYGNNNGRILDVNVNAVGDYVYGSGFNQLLILKQDAEVVEDVEKSCDNCKYDNLSGNEHPCNKCSMSRDRWQTIEPATDKSCQTCKYCHDDECLAKDCNNFSGWVSKPTMVKNGTTKPSGKFENIGRSLGELVDEKQQAYGDAITAIEQMMMVLYPNGVKPDRYRDMLLMVRIMDKQCRIAKGDK